MEFNNNTILVTGGASGIGLALTERFLMNDNEVIICDRQEDKLHAAKERFPKLHIRHCDIGNEKERSDIMEWVLKEFPDFNILVNNAGIQLRISLKDKDLDWARVKQELTINLEAPIHLTVLVIPHLSVKKNSAIINVSSGLAFLPPAIALKFNCTPRGPVLLGSNLSAQFSLSGSTI